MTPWRSTARSCSYDPRLMVSLVTDGVARCNAAHFPPDHHWPSQLFAARMRQCTMTCASIKRQLPRGKVIHAIRSNPALAGFALRVEGLVMCSAYSCVSVARVQRATAALKLRLKSAASARRWTRQPAEKQTACELPKVETGDTGDAGNADCSGMCARGICGVGGALTGRSVTARVVGSAEAESCRRKLVHVTIGASYRGRAIQRRHAGAGKGRAPRTKVAMRGAISARKRAPLKMP